MSSPHSEHRTATTIIIRALSTHIFALVNYGQLSILLNLPSGLHATSVLVFAFYPTLIIAQLVLGIVNAVKYYLRIRNDEGEETQSTSQKPTVSFYFCGILGMHAKADHDTFPGNDEDSRATIPLFSAGHGSVRRTASKITWQWPGRIFLSAVTLTQAILAVLV